VKCDLACLLGFVLCSCATAQKTNNHEGNFKQIMSTQKQIVTRWYAAFAENNPTVLDQVLAKGWRDIPPAPAQPPGPEGAKQILVQLWTTFPDLSIKIEDVLQDGDKVIVRSTISGTQKAPFLGYPAKNRKMTIQAVDIHEVKDGKIIQTWHTEDWMTGFHQLGILEK
jgi:steroid delta-isomerase-like uncharacterized protein